MSTTTRIHSATEHAFSEFLGSLGHRRPVARALPVDVVVIGHTGQVGSALVDSLSRTDGRPDSPRLVLAEAINRSRHLLAGKGTLHEQARGKDALSELGRRLLARGRPAVIVDCTADAELPRHYPEWLRAGIGVVTPNKHGFSADLALYRAIQQAARIGRAPLAYSATVGAGLPILSTLRRLRRAGARPVGLSAAVSGTLVHVFSRMTAGVPLSAAVEDARSRGYTEPDPLEDLSGRDVARKLLIMLREAGLEEIAVDRAPIVDDAWARRAETQRDVIGALAGQDASWSDRMAAARAEGQTWAYLARFGPEGARVGPVQIRLDSPFAGLDASANLARIDLADAPETPLEVHGPGAGVSVTARSVLADLVDATIGLSLRR